jgi:DNA-directed RNA polymerase subunit RPC12/RpoP
MCPSAAANLSMPDTLVPVSATTNFKRPTTCRKCGATFEGSSTGYTVNCPACRGNRRVAAKAAPKRTLTICRCGKTVLAVNGVPNGTICPRECDKPERGGQA